MFVFSNKASTYLGVDSLLFLLIVLYLHDLREVSHEVADRGLFLTGQEARRSRNFERFTEKITGLTRL